MSHAKANQLLTSNDIIRIFTDGSKSSHGTSFAIIFYEVTNYAVQGKLHSNNNIYQAEMNAILLALIITQKKSFKKDVIIFTDSKSTLEALKSRNITSPTLLFMKKLLLQLNRTSQVQIHWCPGHCNIEGNETADYYRKQASQNKHLNTMFIKLPSNALLQEIQEKSKAMWNQRFTESSKSSKLKSFYRLDKFHHNKIRLDFKLTQLITGHNRLNYYLQSIGASDTSICQCGKNVEDEKHFLYECDIYKADRNEMKEKCKMLCLQWPPPFYELVENPLLLDALHSYLNATKRLDL